MISIPLTLGLTACAVMGFGSFEIQREWRNRVSDQLRLDRCVGTEALRFRDLQKSLTKANQRIRATRTAIEAAVLTPIAPEALTALKTALTVQVNLQEGARLLWRSRQMEWLARHGCGTPGDRAMPLPGDGWIRPPADPIGAQALIPDPDLPDSPAAFHAWKGSLHARAKVESSENKHLWIARWGGPGGPGLF